MDRADALREIDRLRAGIMARSQQVHPWYGVCDEMADGGGCAECERVLAALRSPQEEAGGEVGGRNAAFWYDSYRSLAEAVEKHLAAYIIDDDVAEEAIYEEAIEAAGAALARSPGGAEPDERTVYYRRCGWCGAYEGTVDPAEPCAKDDTGYIGPHQFGIYEAAPAGAESSPEATDQGDDHG